MHSILKLLDDGGVFVSQDPCYTKHMNPIARLLCKLDRGYYVRSMDQYVDLLNDFWTKMKYDLKTDTLRFLPYSVIEFENQK